MTETEYLKLMERMADTEYQKLQDERHKAFYAFCAKCAKLVQQPEPANDRD